MDTTFYYEIPVIDKVLTINTPVFNDYAYVRIETNKSYTKEYLQLVITQ